MWHAIYRTADGVLASVGTVVADPLPPGLSAKAIDGDPVGKQWNAQALEFGPVPALPDAWTNYEFRKRLTMAERIAVRERAKTDPIAFDFMDLLDRSGEIIRANPDVLAGLSYLVSVGVLSAGRPTEIING